MSQAANTEWCHHIPCGDKMHAYPGQPALEEFARRVCGMPKNSTRVRVGGYETIETTHAGKPLSPDLLQRANSHVKNCWLRECGKMTEKEVLVELNKLMKKGPDGVQTNYGDAKKMRQIAAVEGWDYLDKEEASDRSEGRGSKSGLQVAELIGGLD